MSKVSLALILRVNDPRSIKYSEECAKSCNDHDLPYKYFEGYYRLPPHILQMVTGYEIRAPKAVLAKNNIPNEFCCAMGHIRMWEEIVRLDKTCAIFEHDVIVKRNFQDVEIPDGVVALLGYRMHSRDDYEPIDLPHHLMDVPSFQGTHAYAMTPTTARLALERVNKQILCSIDGYIGINNMIGMRRMLVNPPPVLCEVGNNRDSLCQDDGCAKYNDYVSPEFIQGIKVPELYNQLTNGGIEYRGAQGVES